MKWLMGKSDDARRLVSQLGNPARQNAAAAELLRMGTDAVDSLVEAVAGKDSNLRDPAVDLLRKMGSTAVPRLSHLLASAHPEIRGHVADILGEIRHTDALPALIEAARGQFYTVRGRAAAALAKIGDSQTIPVLIQLLSDSEPSVRSSAARAFGAFKDESSLLRLSDLLLEDPEIEVRQAAADGLAGSRLTNALPFLIEALADSFWWYERENAAESILDALEAFGADAVAPLIGALSHPESTVRRSAAQVLGRIRDSRAVQPLGASLYDLHIEVGQSAANALVNFGAAALDVLAKAGTHPEAGIRLHAIQALARIHNPNVLPLLEGKLNDPDRHVVMQVIQSLGEVKDDRVIEILTAIANDRSDRELSALARQAIKTHRG